MHRAWNLVLALVVGTALVVQLAVLLAGGADVNAQGQAGAAVELPTRLLRFFSYFTIQSNLLVLAVAISLVADPRRDGALWRVLRLDALLGIAVTGVVFATLLSGLVQPRGIGVWLNAGFHYFSPVWTLAGWLLFGPRPRMDARTLALAFLWPACWLAYTLLHGAWTGWYPYPFVDAGKLGYARVCINSAAILAAALVAALAFKALDGRLAPPRTDFA